MPQTMSSMKWTINEIIANFKCYNCIHDALNTWAPCLRQSAMINCHPNFTSRSRQLWFLMMNFLKYIKSEPEYDDEDFEFNGEHEIEVVRYKPTEKDQRKLFDCIPKHLQQLTIVRRGITI